uniref:NADH-ubiquinone oxidoreductase chain 2 n=1 Tax=Gowidon longirostris TaxID=118216 RepID=F6KXP8_GOWLO|nr:NADH dehydrogenase subunit 2 [Gowidon longirostris]AEF12826.1 NADH dehydrogenase subunit 2 [Gowidon longirostris]
MLRMTTHPIALLGIILGTLMVLSANHWLTAWLGLELNMISILPMITKQGHPRSTEAATKYFLIQALASTLLLLSSTLNAMKTGSWDIIQLDDKLSYTLMIFSLTMKMGAAPFHYWLPEVMQGCTMNTALLISTWQKIAPIALLYMISCPAQLKITLPIGILSILAGGWGGINQTQLRKMMAYSSIAQLGWTIATISIAPNIALMNIIIYMTTSIPFFILLTTTSSKDLKSMTTIWTHSPATAIVLMMLLMSMTGLPPLAGFTPKLLILNELIKHELTMAATIMALSSLLSLIFYLRTMFLLISTMTPATTMTPALWRFSPRHNKIAAILTPIALFNITLLPYLLELT